MRSKKYYTYKEAPYVNHLYPCIKEIKSKRFFTEFIKDETCIMTNQGLGIGVP